MSVCLSCVKESIVRTPKVRERLSNCMTGSESCDKTLSCLAQSGCADQCKPLNGVEVAMDEPISNNQRPLGSDLGQLLLDLKQCSNTACLQCVRLNSIRNQDRREQVASCLKGTSTCSSKLNCVAPLGCNVDMCPLVQARTSPPDLSNVRPLLLSLQPCVELESSCLNCVAEAANTDSSLRQCFLQVGSCSKKMSCISQMGCRLACQIAEPKEVNQVINSAQQNCFTKTCLDCIGENRKKEVGTCIRALAGEPSCSKKLSCVPDSCIESC